MKSKWSVDRVTTADQYRKEATEFFDLAKNAPSPFVRGYYQLAAGAQAFFDALRCRKDFFRFTSAEGAGDHCEMMNRSLSNRRALDWPTPHWEASRTEHYELPSVRPLSPCRHHALLGARWTRDAWAFLAALAPAAGERRVTGRKNPDQFGAA
jgi:hypothetical protein